jgi:hypothetical protein
VFEEIITMESPLSKRGLGSESIQI